MLKFQTIPDPVQWDEIKVGEYFTTLDSTGAINTTALRVKISINEYIAIDQFGGLIHNYSVIRDVRIIKIDTIQSMEVVF